MSRRARAAAFGGAALACAGVAAALTGGYRADLESQLGPLRPVVVSRAAIPAGRRLDPADADSLLEVRRIPRRFAPPGALAAPRSAVGRAPAVRIPAGAPVLGSELRHPRGHRRHPGPPLRGARKPVEIEVSGAEALAATGADPAGSRVDVIVTTEPAPGGGAGRTYVAATGVELLALARSRAGADSIPGPGSDPWTATLALSRKQALRLIQAQSFARAVRLIPH